MQLVILMLLFLELEWSMRFRNQPTHSGIYKGISTPSPRGFLKSGTKVRKALATNLGLENYTIDQQLRSLLLSDYDQLTGSNDGLGGLAFDFELDASNAGEAEVKGIELVHSYTAQMDNVIQFPLFVSATIQMLD